MTATKGDFTDSELRTALATLTGREPGDVLEAIAAVVVRTPAGLLEPAIIVDHEDGAARTAATLRHLADHIDGGCQRCRKLRRKLGRGHPAG